MSVCMHYNKNGQGDIVLRYYGESGGCGMVLKYHYYWCRDVENIKGDLVCSYIERVVVLGQHIMVIEAEDVGILLIVVVYG